MSPTLDNFKFLIMMNQKEMNAQKEPCYFEGGNRAWSALACPLSDEDCPLHLLAVGPYNKHVKPPGQKRRRRKGRQQTMWQELGGERKQRQCEKVASKGECCQATLSWGTSSAVTCFLNPQGSMLLGLMPSQLCASLSLPLLPFSSSRMLHCWGRWHM